MARSAPQRHYRAPCPGCGAPVEFVSAQSTHAVCGYCHSTVVRRGEVLQRIGKMAELFEDHSPLRLHAGGRIALDGGPEQAFTLIGRLQLQGEAGRWSEWVLQLDDGRQATLGEDNGAYVLTRPITLAEPLPEPQTLRPGATLTLTGQAYSVAYSGQAQLLAAEGELPKLPALGQPFALAELRSSDGEVLSIDWGQVPPALERGRAVQLQALQLTGLAGASETHEQARQFNCPRCGAPVQVQLASSKSCTCPACASVIDLSDGVGGALRAASQGAAYTPLIALGSSGRLQGVDWQVVGFQHRSGREAGDDESFGWSEYLLYHRARGFAFLVDAEDGWSLVRPTTGAPAIAQDGRSASYLGQRYALRSHYQAETDYVLGEFYWPVQQGQRTRNSDFDSPRGLLSMEQSASERTWSSGDRMAASTVADAFGLQGQQALFQRDDVGAFTPARGASASAVVLVFFALITLLLFLPDCSGGGGGGYTRSSSGSWGGYSSGGSHK